MDCTSENYIGEKMKKREFSKSIIALSYIIGIILALVVIVCTILGIECSNSSTITMAAW